MYRNLGCGFWFQNVYLGFFDEARIEVYFCSCWRQHLKDMSWEISRQRTFYCLSIVFLRRRYAGEMKCRNVTRVLFTAVERSWAIDTRIEIKAQARWDYTYGRAGENGEGNEVESCKIKAHTSEYLVQKLRLGEEKRRKNVITEIRCPRQVAIKNYRYGVAVRPSQFAPKSISYSHLIR